MRYLGWTCSMTAMPTWSEFMTPMLSLLSEVPDRTLRQLKTEVSTAAQITDDQRAELLPSGEPKTDNRIGWAASYLARVGALERPARGTYRITEMGRELLSAHPNGISETQLRTFAKEDDRWWVSSKATSTAVSEEAEDESAVVDPVEQIETGIARIHSDVASDLLTRLHAKEPAFFEQAVLDLLMAMGYGGAEGKATRTQLVGDAGIDGVIDQDALGLNRVYVQAKRYAPGNAVGRPEIQAFVGALHGAQANQGVFITTGRFSSGAVAYADSVPTRVVLINGQRLSSLMIRFGVGVQVKRTVQIVEVDEDFFE